MPRQPISPDPEPNSVGRTPDLRTRRRIRTKQMLQREALRLFTDKGYDQTTVDDIAHAAAMSSRTFFRYFPSKEDVVLWDEYDERPVREFWQALPGEDPLAQLILRVREVIADIYHKDPQLLLTRVRLSFAVPEVRARFINAQMTMVGPFVEELADAVGVQRDDLKLPVTLAALFSAMLVAVERWQSSDGHEDLLVMFDAAIAALAAGATDLRDTVRAASPADGEPTLSQEPAAGWRTHP